MIKTPTDKEKIEMYEGFLHDLNMYCVCCSHDKIQQLVSNADSWSYMHRVGNGMMTEEEQQECINRAFWKLRKVKDES